MTGRGRGLAVAVSLIALAASAGAAAAGGGEPAGGAFSPPFAEDPAFDDRPPRTHEEAKRVPTAVHMAMLPDGRVAYWGGFEGVEDLNGPGPVDIARVVTPSRSRILDLRSGSPVWSAPGNNTGGPGENEDLFCVDQRLLPDGRLLAVGGSLWVTPVDLTPITGDGGPAGSADVYGTDATRWLDFRSERPAWVGGDEHRMHEDRWYPTLVTLTDGRLLVASGVGRLVYNVPGAERGTASNVRKLEAFDSRTNRWTREPDSADVSLPLYPRLHLTHDGKVLYTGVGQMWSPFGQTPDEALWNLHQLYDPVRGDWTVAGLSPTGARSDAFSVPLLFEPPYDETRILVGGGTLGISPTTYVATNSSELVSYEDGRTSSEPVGDLRNRRWFSSGVLLPSGEVVALAGGDRNANLVPGTDAAVREAELFDPVTKRWAPLASARRERTYHSSALLLPDGRVLLGGHAPQQAGGQDHATSNAGVTAPNLKDPSFEVFTPPYLDPERGPRPRIERAHAAMAYGSRGYGVEVSGDVERLVLTRLPSTTHVLDADQRGVELAFERAGDRTLRVTAPPDGRVAPPGYYYLFALSETGVPSKARVVQVGERPDARGPATAPFGT